jgi:UDP-2-acetamido-3-amino-2,3-dideoxy-glucuronate N-acetyltransferase
MSSLKNSEIFIHSSSFVDEGAEIGLGTSIWHFSHISAGSKIGTKCKIGQNVFVAPRVKIGSNVKIQNNVSIYEGVELADDVFCGPSMVFTNVRNPRSATPRNRPEDYHKTKVGQGVSFGANCTVVCGVTIGSWAFIGAGAVVTKDVQSHALIAGNPARQIGWACFCGLKLKEESSQGVLKCPECHKKFKTDSVLGLVET